MARSKRKFPVGCYIYRDGRWWYEKAYQNIPFVVLKAVAASMALTPTLMIVNSNIVYSYRYLEILSWIISVTPVLWLPLLCLAVHEYNNSYRDKDNDSWLKSSI